MKVSDFNCPIPCLFILKLPLSLLYLHQFMNQGLTSKFLVSAQQADDPLLWL